MQPSIEARNLITQGKLRDASSLLERELSKTRDNDDLWYLRGIISLKLSNYDYAQECFEYAKSIRNRAEYHKISGMAHMEMFEIEDAVEAFARAIELDSKDAENYFFMAVCLIFIDDPRSKQYMEKAYLRDRKKVRELLGSFYKNILAPDPNIKLSIKKELEKKISAV